MYGKRDHVTCPPSQTGWSGQMPCSSSTQLYNKAFPSCQLAPTLPPRCHFIHLSHRLRPSTYDATSPVPLLRLPSPSLVLVVYKTPGLPPSPFVSAGNQPQRAMLTFVHVAFWCPPNFHATLLLLL